MTAAALGAPGYDMVRSWYDGLGRPATILSYMSGQPRYLNHQYDLAGNREHLTHTNDNARFRYHHDVLGRVGAVHDKGEYTGPDDLVVRYLHRDEGQRQVALFGSGSAGLSTGYYYDAAQRLSAIGNDLAAPGADWSIQLAYNPASQIVRRELSHNSYAWTGAVDASLSYTANGLNQYSQVEANSYSYDANGNLVSDGITTYTYDVENRLVGASNGATLVYDPLGRLAEVSKPGMGTTRFHYDGDRLVAEYDSAGTLLRRYVHGPGTDEPVAVYEGPALTVTNRRYLLADERGSIAALVPTDGSAPAVNSYDEYGVPAATNTGRFQYTGQAWIPELGLYYYKARFYSPKLGRFMQPDPIGYGDGMNLYAYVKGDPVNFRDPLGLEQDLPDIVITGSKPKVAVSMATGGAAWPAVSRNGRGNTVDECHIPQIGGVQERWGEGIPPQGPQPIPPTADPKPDKRRDGCGNPLPPASRRYSLPPGYSRYVDPQNRTVRDPNGKTVNNPYYQHAFDGKRGVDVGGVASDLAEITGAVLASQANGAFLRFIFGGTRGPQIQSANRVNISVEDASRNAGGRCSR